MFTESLHNELAKLKSRRERVIFIAFWLISALWMGYWAVQVIWNPSEYSSQRYFGILIWLALGTILISYMVSKWSNDGP